LKTTDKATAKKRAELVVRKYFKNQIETLEKKKVQLISEYLNEYSGNRGDLSLKTLRMDHTAVNSLIEVINDQPIKDIDGSHISKFISTHQNRGTKKHQSIHISGTSRHFQTRPGEMVLFLLCRKSKNSEQESNFQGFCQKMKKKN